MTKEEYFKDWLKVIDLKELDSVVHKISIIYSKEKCCPFYSDIFKVFNVTPYSSLCQVWLGQDPYFQSSIATGVAFANKKGTVKLSPSLNLLKEAAINFEIPHNCINFDPTLEEWSKQGILLLNSALTVKENIPGSHLFLWKEFIAKFLMNLSLYNPGLIYILWGNKAKSFKPYINSNNTVFVYNHPSYYARNNIRIPSSIFYNLSNKNLELFGRRIKWFKELDI